MQIILINVYNVIILLADSKISKQQNQQNLHISGITLKKFFKKSRLLTEYNKVGKIY